MPILFLKHDLLKQFGPGIGVAAIGKNSVFKRDFEQVCTAYTHTVRHSAGIQGCWCDIDERGDAGVFTVHERIRRNDKERDVLKEPVIV